MLTLIDADGRVHEIPTWAGYAEAAALTDATGWKLRSAGLCKDDVCVPLFGRAVASPADPGLIDLDTWAVVLGLLSVRDETHEVMAVVPSVGWRRMSAEELLALAHRRIAGHHHRAGRADAARQQLAIAQVLAPWEWSQRRGGIAVTGGDPLLDAEFTWFWEEWDASGRPGYTPTT